MGTDLVMLSAVAALSLSPRSNILPELIFGAQINGNSQSNNAIKLNDSLRCAVLPVRLDKGNSTA